MENPSTELPLVLPPGPRALSDFSVYRACFNSDSDVQLGFAILSLQNTGKLLDRCGIECCKIGAIKNGTMLGQDAAVSGLDTPTSDRLFTQQLDHIYDFVEFPSY